MKSRKKFLKEDDFGDQGQEGKGSCIYIYYVWFNLCSFYNKYKYMHAPRIILSYIYIF